MNLLTITRVFLGIIFIWYGILKFFSGVSPAEGLAMATIDKLFFSLIPPTVSIVLLAIWEVVIGLGFLFGKYLKYISIIYLIHISLTFTPLILLPDICFTNPPFEFTIVGQYIGKNLVFFMVGLMIYKQSKEL